MIIPAQAMMLWCGMDMSDDSSMMQMHSEMSTHSAMSTPQNESMTHCESSDAPSEVPVPVSDNTSKHCSINIDCNCIVKQQNDAPASSVITPPLILKAQISTNLLSELLTLSDSNEAFPPPLWNSASYTPPSLFLANEAFLI
jgi:hypothetical protein